jgi:hypothetical protein
MSPIRSFILAFIIGLPFFARSQQGDLKLYDNRPAPEKPAMHPRSSPDMALLQDQGKTGGWAEESEKIPQSGMFLDPQWTAGYVVLGEKSVFDDLLLRYDLYHQQFHFIRNGDTMAFSRPEELLMINMGGRRFIYTEFEDNGAIRKGFFEQMSDEDCRLLARHTVKYHMDPGSRPRLDEDLYVQECQYYVKKKSDPARPVRICRKGVLCAFRDKEDQIKAFMDDNGIKMKTCDELRQVVDYYNSLVR